VALLERPGEIVSREDLRRRLGPSDTFVDFDHSLNTVVNRLRDCLSDGAERPRFIETLPRRCYRFSGRVDPNDHPAGTTAETPQPAATTPPRSSGISRGGRIAIAAAATIAVVGWIAVKGLRPGGAARSQRIMLAVLPLDDLSPDRQGSYFADGLTE